MIVNRMVAVQTRGEEDRMGEILLLLDRYYFIDQLPSEMTNV